MPLDVQAALAMPSSSQGGSGASSGSGARSRQRGIGISSSGSSITNANPNTANSAVVQQLRALLAATVASPVATSRPLPIRRRGARVVPHAMTSSGGGGAAATSVAVAPAAPPTNAATAAAAAALPDFGYARDFEAKYALGRELGRGGNAVVRLATDRATGAERAVKVVRKQPPPGASEAKRAGHAEAIRREVDVMRQLAGSLAVAQLLEVFEDDDAVYLVQELCRGGTLADRISGDSKYSERTAASYMRAVLRTIAQCHSAHVLHRDIKPGNFMLLDGSERAPVKAIDFGLATPFDPAGPPRSDLGLEGTPWFQSPETLSSAVGPAADVWAAGIMAAQLLTGRLPFDDRRNPHAPAVNAIWRSILTDKIDFGAKYWAGVSGKAKDFVAALLDKDPEKRPTAKEALRHPWLRGDSAERGSGRPLAADVVARIQRFAAASAFKRSVLQMMAEELLAAAGEEEDLGGGGGSNDGNSAAARLAAAADARTLRELYGALQLDGAAPAVPAAQAADALARLAHLAPSEAARLAEQLDTSRSGRVRRAAVAASQLDWGALKAADADAWAGAAARAFAALDVDGDGRLSSRDVAAALAAKRVAGPELDEALARVASEAALARGGGGDANASALGRSFEARAAAAGSPGGLDFDAFLRMLSVGSADSLEQYARSLDTVSPGSLAGALNDSSAHGGAGGGSTCGASSDGSSHRGRRPRGANAAAPGALAALAEARTGASSPSPRQAAPSFRFDVAGGNSGGAAGADAAAASPRVPVPASAAPHAPWKASAHLSAPAPALWGGSGGGIGAAGVGAPTAGGGVDRRMHGAMLYKNNALGTGRAPGMLATVRE